MKIKRIEICGFKSFVDKTVISFPDPITAIVGPNGCGKSNIVDAIRWVMGEQSAKHLRGRAMEDVIFAGSETRGPAGLAEVSLVFDARSLPGDAAPGGVPWGAVGPEEVVVTRRLFRAGESEYLLNGVPGRLRDVVDFFLGTGVGSKAYAIIEQGRIGFIVSSRADDRRGLIDEAAGITKYKAKKRAAERRMESTRQHLLRVSDVIAEIEGRLRSLRLQAQKAERYKRYKTELKDLELWAASQRYLGFLAEEKSLRSENETVRGRHEETASGLHTEELAVETERLAVMEEMTELNLAKEELFGLANKAQNGQQRAALYGEEAESLEKRAAAAREEAAALAARVETTVAELARLDGELERIDGEAVSRRQEVQARQQDHDAVRAELAQMRRALDACGTEVAALMARIARTEAERDSAAARIDDLTSRREACAAEASLTAERLLGLGAEATGLQSTLGEISLRQEELTRRRDEAQARQATLRDELGRGELALETLREEAHRRRSRLASLTEIHDRYESFQRGVRAIMQRRASAEEGGERLGGIRGVVADIVQAPPELETAVEAVLGERLGNIIVESHETGMEAIEYLKSRSEGRSSFIPVALRADAGEVLYDATGGLAVDRGQGRYFMADAPDFPSGEGVRGPLLELVGYDRGYDRVASYLLGDVVVVEDLKRAFALWRDKRPDKTLVTLDGEVLDPHGVVTGGSKESAVAGVLGQKREIRELQEVVERIDLDYKAALEQHVSLKQELGAVTHLLEELAVRGRSDEVGLVSHRKDLDRVAAETARLEAHRRELDRQTEELEAARRDGERRVVEASARLEEDRAAVGDKEGLSADLRRRVDDLAPRLDALVVELTALEVAAAQAEDRRGAAHDTRARLLVERDEHRSRGGRLDASAGDDLARAAALRADAERLRQEAALWQAEAEERARLHAERQAAVELRNDDLGRREADLRGVRGAVERMAQDLSRLDLKTQEVTLKRTALEEHVVDRYADVLLPRVVFDYHLRRPVGPDEDARQQELRGLIERMGEINLTAIEESEELQKRFDFLTTQRADLESAIAQLEAAIERINRASRKKFRETFDLVNAKFQELFPRLFGGGRAHLALTDDADLLETGVEIAANPPGKKVMQNIELLSGGEKALTAVSLLFAIFLVKPSPFCLLDEVDAPLDEANVGRFNQIVRDMTGRSQFIMITHNRRTMEIADRLCGITMEQPGVSKLVAVNLKGGTPGRAEVATAATAAEDGGGAA